MKKGDIVWIVRGITGRPVHKVLEVRKDECRLSSHNGMNYVDRNGKTKRWFPKIDLQRKASDWKQYDELFNW
tara:strand:- start:1018 stop:1233 length:216 start_codon:yes stop_codon:yes gene_type:complete